MNAQAFLGVYVYIYKERKGGREGGERERETTVLSILLGMDNINQDIKIDNRKRKSLSVNMIWSP